MKNPEFHLTIIKGPGEVDLVVLGFLRGKTADFVLRQIPYSKNERNLPVDSDIPAMVSVSGLEMLNIAEHTFRIHGSVRLCVDGSHWGGHHVYWFVADYNMHKREGKAAISRTVEL